MGSINNTISVGRNVVDVNEAIRANVVVGRTLQCIAFNCATIDNDSELRQVGETYKINLVYVGLDCFSLPSPSDSGFWLVNVCHWCHFNVCPVRTCSSESKTMLGVNASGRDKCREQLFVSLEIRWEHTHTHTHHAAAMCTPLTTRRRRASVTIFCCEPLARPSNAKSLGPRLCTAD